MSEGLPQRLGAYEVDGVLGRGGMGIVYRARSDSDERVAIKTVMAGVASQQSAIRREVSSLSRIDHPGVVRIVDSGTVDAVPWYAMVLLEGMTLGDYIQALHSGGSAQPGSAEQTLTLAEGAFADPTLALDHTTLDPQAVADARAEPLLPAPAPVTVQGKRLVSGQTLQRSLLIARRLMATLAHLHAFGLVHRDIKPANIFLVRGDSPVLVDFGLSHAGAISQSREVLVSRESAAGTPAYMAPEVIRGHSTDARADIYSAGCVLFELFAGRPPFGGATVRRLLNQHLTDTPPRLDERVDGVPPPVVNLITRMLRKDPRERLGHAADAAAVLRAVGPPVQDDYTVPVRMPQLYRPRLAGRSALLARLCRQMTEVARGHGGFTVVQGRSGMGKTYLVAEAVRRLDVKVAVVPGRCAPVGPRGATGGAPLHPLGELFEHLTDSCSSDPKLSRAVLADRGPLLAPFSDRLAALPGHEDWPAPTVLEGAALRQRLVSAVCDTLVAYSAHRPLLLLIDDVQWADGLTLEVLKRLGGDALAETPLRVVATCRSDEVHPALEPVLEGADRVDIGMLERPAIHEIIRDMLSTSKPAPELVDHLVATAGGSPFYVAEYLRTAHALGVLGEGAQVEAGRLAEVPGSLSELVRSRLDLLPPTERLLTDLAAVMGRSVDERVLAGAAGLDEPALHAALHELERLQVFETSSHGMLQLAHDKLTENAYDALDASRRADLHGRVAHAIEDAHATDLASHHATLGFHHERAGHPDRALGYYRQAAEAAFARLAYERAVAMLLRVEELGEQSLRARDKAHYSQMLGECYWSLGDMPKCELYTVRAFEQLGERLPTGALGWTGLIVQQAAVQGLHLLGLGVGTVSDPEAREDLRRLAVASNTLCWRYLFDDNIPFILALAISAANRVERADPPIPLATAHGWLAFNAGALRLHGLAARYFRKAHASAEQANDLPGSVFTILMEGLYQAGFGRFDELQAGSRRALTMLDGQGDPQNEELHHTMLGNTLFYQGRFQDSARHFDRVHALAVARANAQHTAWGLYARCWAMLAQGDFETALPRLEAARDLLAANADLASEIIVFAQLALVRTRRGDPAGARADLMACAERIQQTKVANYPTAPSYGLAAELAIELAGLRPDDTEIHTLAARLVRDTRLLTLLLPYSACIAQRVQGLLWTHQGRHPKAVRRLRKAAATADSLGMAYEAAQSWWALAVHHAACVPEAPAEARRRLSELGAAWHLDQLPT